MSTSKAFTPGAGGKNIGNKSKTSFWQYFKLNYDLYIFLIPAVVLIFIFSYVPLYGVQIAFKDFSVRQGIMGSDWVGLEHFTRFFNSPNCGQIIWNTLTLSLYSLVVGFPIPIILALLLNAMKSPGYRKVIQTVTYAPNFISTVVICGMILLFLSPRNGFVNSMLTALGLEQVNFMGKPELFQSIYVWSGVWQGSGWGSIIYFAALSGVSPELHEAAIVDGATRMQRVLHIDFPSILPTATIMLIMSCGSLLSIGFEKVYLLQNPLNLSTSEIISTYVYKTGLVDNNMGFSTAINLFNSVVNCVLLTIVNYVSGKLSGNSLW